MRPLNDGEERRLCDAYRDGVGFEPLASRFRCSTTTVRQVLVKHGVEIRRTRPTSCDALAKKDSP